jgi:succinate dehydrogenase/fumarate reductase flavoprotein subunit
LKTYTTDVVVISAGTAGLPTAVTAAENGASVIAQGKTGRTGGCANRGNDIFGVESKLQKAQEGYMTREQAFKTQMDWTHWRVDTQLVSAIINKSSSTIDWLQNLGVEFEERGKMFAGMFGKNGPPKGFSAGPNCTLRIKGEPPGPRQIGQAAAMAKILTPQR